MNKLGALGSLKYIVQTRLLDRLQQSEVERSLSFHRWQTKDEILSVINQERRKEGRVEFNEASYVEADKIINYLFLLSLEINNRINVILRDLVHDGLAEEKDENEVSTADRGWSQDPTISDAKLQQSRLQNRGGYPRLLYRKTKGTPKLDKEKTLLALPEGSEVTS